MSQEFEYDVFLSHNCRDKPRVREIAGQLRDRGLRVWFDEWILKAGDDIYLQIEHGLEQSRVLVLFMSEAAFGSDWVALEHHTVLFRDPANKNRRFIPLLLEDCEVPDTIRRFKYIDGRMPDDKIICDLVNACLPKSERPPRQASTLRKIPTTIKARQMVPDTFRRGLKKPFERLRRRAIVILVFLVAATGILLVPALRPEVALANLVQSDFDDMLMITYETINEKGDDFVAAKRDHAEMLARYIGHMEERHMKLRHLDFILCRLYPELSPKKQLLPVLADLRIPTDDPNEARKSIEVAGEALKRYCLTLKDSSRREGLPTKYESFSEEFLAATNKVLDDSHDAVDTYSIESNLENAKAACRKSRMAIVFLYPVAFRYPGEISEEKLYRFKEDIQRTIVLNNSLYENLKDAHLPKYTDSEKFRLRILQAVLDNNMPAAREMLTTALKKAAQSENEQAP